MQPSARTPALCNASIQRCQSSPPITFTVAEASSSLAGSALISESFPVNGSSVFPQNALPKGLRTDLCITPVSGSTRTGLAKLYTIKSNFIRRFFASPITVSFMPSEKASPSMVTAVKPASFAA